MTVMMLWKEGWPSEGAYLPSGAKGLNHLMRHVVEKVLGEWHLIVPSEQFQRYQMRR